MTFCTLSARLRCKYFEFVLSVSFINIAVMWCKAVLSNYTINSTGDEIANVNFLYDDIVHVLYDSLIGLLYNEAYS